MSLTKRVGLLAGAATLAITGAGFGDTQAAQNDAMAQIEALIGEAACRSDDDCRVIGVGANACGGPDAYRAWSVMQTDTRLLEALVAHDAAARRQQMERMGIASTCAILPVPGVACVGRPDQGAVGRCMLLPSAAGLK